MFDVHTHFIPPAILDWLKENQERVQAKREKKDEKKAEFLVINGKWGFELKEEFIRQDRYLQRQMEAGVIHSLVSPVPQLFLYDLPWEVTAEMSHVYNQSLADWVSGQPDKLSALATLPLNNPEQAAVELNKTIYMGLKGAIIGPGTGQKMLTHPDFTPFWEEANRLKAIIFIHPLLCEDPRLKQRMLPNLIGVPWETTVCAADLLLSGLLDQYADAKILLAHGGGFLPYQIGRLNKGYDQWQAVSRSLQAQPHEYLKRFWYDNVLWSPASISFLVETVGEDRVLPGSDYPFDLCVWPPASTSQRNMEKFLDRSF